MVHLGVSPVPPQRDPEPDEGPQPTSRDVLRGLGLDVLVEIIETSAYGVCITGDDHTWVYLNPAGSAIVGQRFEELRGRDYLQSFPEHEREALLALEGEQRAGDRSFYTNTLVRADGTEREMTWSGTVVRAGDVELAPAIFHDTSGVRRAHREAATLAAAAARVAAGGDMRGVLDVLARAAVATTRAVACFVLVEQSGQGGRRVEVRGRSEPADALDGAVAAAGVTLADLPGGSLALSGRLVHLADHRTRLLADARAAALVTAGTQVPWEGSALIPVRREGAAAGCFVVLLPPEVRSPSEQETAFWSSLADQASAALAQEQLRHRAADFERRRIGRDLHDSVSQGLFVLNQRAGLIERAVTAGDTGTVAAAAAGLHAVAQQSIRDLRALLEDLRPVLADPPELGQRLRALAAEVAERHGLPVEVELGAGLDAALARLSPSVAEHLWRVAGEAVHNAAKHAAASKAVVTARVHAGHHPRPGEVPGGHPELVLAVRDDGCGFDPDQESGGHGQRTMRERAALCGGVLEVTTAPDSGCTVVLRVPLPLAG